MPQFHLDTAGKAYVPISETSLEARRWDDLDAFTQGYIEAMFFTETEDGGMWWESGGPGTSLELHPVGFSDLAPESLASILDDCWKFQEGAAYETMEEAKRRGSGGLGSRDHNATQAGRDFWFTRNGHGVGFWDGDWPEPYATALDGAAKAFPGVDAYLGDDGKVHLS